jgi:hypothetical protein
MLIVLIGCDDDAANEKVGAGAESKIEVLFDVETDEETTDCDAGDAMLSAAVSLNDRTVIVRAWTAYSNS